MSWNLGFKKCCILEKIISHSGSNIYLSDFVITHIVMLLIFCTCLLANSGIRCCQFRDILFLLPWLLLGILYAIQLLLLWSCTLFLAIVLSMYWIHLKLLVQSSRIIFLHHVSMITFYNMWNHLSVKQIDRSINHNYNMWKGLIPWWKGFEELELDIEEPYMEEMIETLQTGWL